MQDVELGHWYIAGYNVEFVFEILIIIMAAVG